MASRRLVCALGRKPNLAFLPNHSRHQRNYYEYHKEKYYSSTSAVSQQKFHFSNQAPSKCWNCNSVFKSQLFCSRCKVLQEPPESLTYFDVIGIPRRYDVSANDIRNKYKDLQWQLHPDKFGSKSEREKQISETFSTLVNKAYSTLTNPLSRGLYLLKLDGISISEGTTKVDPMFLAEIMEQNEEIESAEGDASRISELADRNKRTLDTLSKQLADAFGAKDIDKAKEIVIKMKYFDSIDSRLKKLKHDLGIVE